MPIHDARLLNQAGGSLGMGFMPTEQRSDVLDFDSDRQVKDVGHRDAATLLRHVTGEPNFRMSDRTLHRRAAQGPPLALADARSV